ncbi:hypothetical protein ElyMa_003536200 [Elysia marginata]|uniref:Uncharacterized protein n=1 Tax=Elysia marginata TaxID=1093978 RepID=A0AAV4EHU9_9GAST|nr:hypothetical protein ElyMa_003536200 [Elysia marginata]
MINQFLYRRGMPPCHNALMKHGKRANYNVSSHDMETSISSISESSLTRRKWLDTDRFGNDSLELDWCDGQILLSEITDILDDIDCEFTQEHAMNDQSCDAIKRFEDSKETGSGYVCAPLGSSTAGHHQRCFTPTVVFPNAICLVSFTAFSPYTYTAISMINAESRFVTEYDTSPLDAIPRGIFLGP